MQNTETSGIDIVSKSPLSLLILCKRNSSATSGNCSVGLVGHIDSGSDRNDGPFCYKLWKKSSKLFSGFVPWSATFDFDGVQRQSLGSVDSKILAILKTTSYLKWSASDLIHNKTVFETDQNMRFIIENVWVAATVFISLTPN